MILHTTAALLLGCVTFLHSAGCDVQPDDCMLQIIYDRAVIDAVVAEEAEIVSDLVPIVTSNTDLRWNDGRVLVVTFTGYPESYPEGATITTWWGDTWVTVVPELKRFFHCAPVPAGAETLRVEQLLGMPAGTGNRWFAELWVLPEDLFRPCPDSEITDTVCVLDLPDNATDEHSDWYNSQILQSYFEDQTSPWTRLGYTYDWGCPVNETGLSEFVIRPDSDVVVESCAWDTDYVN